MTIVGLGLAFLTPFVLLMTALAMSIRLELRKLRELRKDNDHDKKVI